MPQHCTKHAVGYSTHPALCSRKSASSCAGGHLPSVTIEYRDIEIEADALVGSSSVPSLTNATWQFLKVRSELKLCGTAAWECMLLYVDESCCPLIRVLVTKVEMQCLHSPLPAHSTHLANNGSVVLHDDVQVSVRAIRGVRYSHESLSLTNGKSLCTCAQSK